MCDRSHKSRCSQDPLSGSLQELRGELFGEVECVGSPVLDVRVSSHDPVIFFKKKERERKAVHAVGEGDRHDGEGSTSDFRRA